MMEKDFNYVIKLSDTSISGLFGDAEFVNGKATIHLKSGESANILELPSGITYTIEQTDVNQKIYTTTTKEETGTIKVGGTSTAEFENTRYLSLALTGGNSTFWTVYRIAIVVSIFLGIYLIKHKKKV